MFDFVASLSEGQIIGAVIGFVVCAVALSYWLF